MRYHGGLAASPPVRYKLRVERGGYSPYRNSPPPEAAAQKSLRAAGTHTSIDARVPAGSSLGTGYLGVTQTCRLLVFAV